MPGSTAWLHSFSIQYEKVVFPSQAEYSYFSAGFRLKIILCYFKKERISHDTLCGFVHIYGTNVLHVPFIELSLALNIWLPLVQGF